jgi:Na+-transporting NADH:ubiquinone oxidoreductase subunit NqrB
MAAMATTTGTPYQPTRLLVAAAQPAPRAAVTVARTRGGLDPRLYQIAALSGLLAYGLLRLDLEVQPARAAIILVAVLATQYVCTLVWRLPAFDPRSALISGLSLCLLLRTNSTALAVAGAVLAIAGKFLIRVRGKHVFNPTNFALAILLLTGGAWVSPGQWGSAAFFGFLMACVGGLVVSRAARSDVTIAFLAAYASLVLGRSLWLGEPMAIPIHRLENGALLLFAFFMISDPRTTPDRRAGRVLFAVLVALGAAYVQFRLFRTNGLLWSLAVFSPLVPLIDRLLPAAAHRWPGEPLRRSA